MKANSLLFETIRIQNGRVRNIAHHNIRCNNARKVLLGVHNDINLRNAIDTNQASSEEVKCRITYAEDILKVEYEPYAIKPIQSLSQVEIGSFTYTYKYVDRKILTHYYSQRGMEDDILMTKNGWIKDTYYANVALSKNGIWYTPDPPLLNGTSRSRLIAKGILIPQSIHIDQIHEFSDICIFNAMIPFKKIILPVQKVKLLNT